MSERVTSLPALVTPLSFWLPFPKHYVPDITLGTLCIRQEKEAIKSLGPGVSLPRVQILIM